jgi:hypothetical protein
MMNVFSSRGRLQTILIWPLHGPNREHHTNCSSIVTFVSVIMVTWVGCGGKIYIVSHSLSTAVYCSSTIPVSAVMTHYYYHYYYYNYHHHRHFRQDHYYCARASEPKRIMNVQCNWNLFRHPRQMSRKEEKCFQREVVTATFRLRQRRVRDAERPNGVGTS